MLKHAAAIINMVAVLVVVAGPGVIARLPECLVPTDAVETVTMIVGIVAVLIVLGISEIRFGRIDQALRRSSQASKAAGQHKVAQELLQLANTIRTVNPTLHANATLESMSLRRRIYWWIVAKSGWLPPWHRG